ncbi:MAG: NAD-dependent epimerase/dehydratase family protein [Acidobacteria bacterium]|nr:NAD-dependent epimerase/dehydratase family protein [Acidobacteriota bacterium]
MKTVLVTGATGSVGSNVCRLAAERGLEVRALVRDPDSASPLADLGVELVTGDVTDLEGMVTAAKGVDGIVHCAAQIGGTWSTVTAEDFEAVNQYGTFNVLDAAERNDVAKTVVLLSAVVCERDISTITETSPIVEISPKHSPYARTKLAAFYEGMARAARGKGVTFVIPGGIYGPTPIIERALVPSIFTGTLMMAARGELTEYLPGLHTWVLGSDVAEVSLAALEKGRIGARYLALGRPEDVCSLPAFCNAFLSLAGIDGHVDTVDVKAPGVLDDKRWGSMINYLRDSHPDPMHDPTRTTAELGVVPASLDEGLRATVDWLRANGKI